MSWRQTGVVSKMSSWVAERNCLTIIVFVCKSLQLSVIEIILPLKSSKY